MSDTFAVELSILSALAAARTGLAPRDLEDVLGRAGVASSALAAARARLLERGHLRERAGVLDLTAPGVRALIDLHARLEAALEGRSALEEECPSLPWLTTVRTCWIEAVAIQYAVDPDALRPLLPPPLEPEIHKGTAWVSILKSSLSDMRPQGAPALFGVCFYQVSYRAAVTYRAADQTPRRGGFFIRTETNHPVMRSIGNSLAEFKFHDFGLADMVMLREGARLTIGVDPEPAFPNGRLVGVFDTTPLATPPAGSVWGSVEELHDPLVECYDALGVDADAGFLYVLTIDRDPWTPSFVASEHLYCEYFDTGPLGGGASRLDSVLHLTDCRYFWRPLRRERLPGTG